MPHPPYTFEHERQKVEARLPAARRYIVEHAINEVHEGELAHVGIVVQGGLYNALVAALETAGLVDAEGRSRIPILVLNATYPLVPDELVDFAKRRLAVLVLEEGHPEFIEFELAAVLARAGVDCAIRG
jgi:indolepyruvate ferredoxin oxidoreductase alpha subunit